ncbi:unnamed protein product, partial [Symbiodinium pilosum]
VGGQFVDLAEAELRLGLSWVRGLKAKLLPPPEQTGESEVFADEAQRDVRESLLMTCEKARLNWFIWFVVNNIPFGRLGAHRPLLLNRSAAGCIGKLQRCHANRAFQVLESNRFQPSKTKPVGMAGTKILNSFIRLPDMACSYPRKPVAEMAMCWEGIGLKKLYKHQKHQTKTF